MSRTPQRSLPVSTGELSLRRDPDAPAAWFVDVDERRQSHVDLENPRRLALGYVRRMGHVIDLLPPPGAPLDVVHLGGGGLTLARYVAATRPGSRQRVFEIDELLTNHVRRLLPLDPRWRIRVRTCDALDGLRTLRPGSADLVIADVYCHGRTPEHLAGTDFVAEVTRVLRGDGTYLANLLDPVGTQRAIGELATVMTTVAALLDLRRRTGTGNVVVMGTNADVPLEVLRSRLAADPAPARVVVGS